MKKVRKKTGKLIEELLSLRESRKSIDDFNFSFLINFSEYSRLMHSIISKKNKDCGLLDVAYRQYFVFLVSCWETFFRDLFVFVHTRDSNAIEKLLEEMNITECTHDLSSISLAELLSKSFNFQNLSDLEIAYNSMWDSNFMENLCSTETGICGMGGEVAEKFSIVSLFPDWHNLINKAFGIRHKVIHDANYRPKYDAELSSKVELLFLLIPQLVTYIIAKRYDLKHVMFSINGVSVPYVFSISDVLSDDWELAS